MFYPEHDVEGSKGTLIKAHGSKPSYDGSAVYFAAENLNGTSARVTAYCGKILLPPMTIEEFCAIAQFEDTEGNRKGLYHSAE